MNLYDIANRQRYRLIATKAQNGQRCLFTYALGTAYLQPLDNSGGGTVAVPLSALHEAIRQHAVEILSECSNKGQRAPKPGFRAMRRVPLVDVSVLELGVRVRGAKGPALGVQAHIDALKALQLSSRLNTFSLDSFKRGA